MADMGSDDHEEGFDFDEELSGAQARTSDQPALSAPGNQAVDAWLESSERDQVAVHASDPAASLTAKPAKQQGPVAALVEQFEHLGSAEQHTANHSLASLLDSSLTASAAQAPLKSALSQRLRLTPLELPGPATPGDTTQGILLPPSEPPLMPSKPWQPSLQGAAARNGAAVAAHNARLHLGIGHPNQQGSRQAAAQPTSNGIHRRRSALNLTIDAPHPFSDQGGDLCPERSSISSTWANIRRNGPLDSQSSMTSGTLNSPASPRRPPLRRFGSVAPTSSLGGTQSGAFASPRRHLSTVTVADIMRQSSAASKGGSMSVGRSLPARAMSRQNAPAATVADIMRHNTLLSPLDFIPQSPAWPQHPLSSVRSGFPVAPLSTTSSNDGGWHADGSHDTRRESPDCWSDPGDSSLALTARGRVMLPPITPTHSGLLPSPGAQAQRPTNK